MHIKEIIIDGFKSYLKRTKISGFDASFNAITGPNGTGKSNILDAICFVLGITNLSQVRAKTLQELVYKNGQAGITKASVSIIFDNEDKKQSPIGYENFNEIIVTRTVVIGGKNKYSINGAPVLANKISNLFMSVQLNVNNPHFLIMQGRIDGVVKMKPLELLSMLEEAAGTRMFEQKKTRCNYVNAKKDKKIEEITNVLEQEIKPTLENLKKEKASYLKFTNLQREVETKTRFIAAHDYYQAKKRIASNDVADLEKKKRKKSTKINN